MRLIFTTSRPSASAAQVVLRSGGLGLFGSLGLLLALLTPGPARGELLRPRPENVIVAHEPATGMPLLGPRHAPVTLEFYMPLTAWQIIRLHRSVEALARRHPTRLRVLYRLVGSGDQMLAESAMEAFAQGRFFAFMEELAAFAEMSQRMPVWGPELVFVCERAGVDFERVQAARADRRHQAAIERNDHDRWRRGFGEPPLLLLNGMLTAARAHHMDLDTLESNYDIAYAAARRMMDEGVPVEHVYQQSLRELALARRPPVVYVSTLDPEDDQARGPRPSMRRIRIDAPALLGPQDSAPGHELGPADAPVSVRFYCDFLSDGCAYLKNTLDQLLVRYGDEVLFVFHPMFPPGAEGQARRALLHIHHAALCAAEQDAFWAYYDNAYRHLVPRRQRGIAVDEQIRQIADSIMDLDRRAFDACMDRPSGARAVDEQVRAANRAGVTRSPTVVIAGRIYPGSTGLTELRSLIEEERRPGLLEELAPSW